MLLPGPDIGWLFLAPLASLVIPFISCLLGLHGRTADSSRLWLLIAGTIIGVVLGVACGYASFLVLSLFCVARPLAQVTMFPMPGILLGGCVVPILYVRKQTKSK